MTIDIIFGFPLGEDAIGDRVEARHSVVFDKEAPYCLMGLAEGYVVLAQRKDIEGRHQH